MTEQPAGRVTLVFTDVESSTRLMEELGEDEYREALARHREAVRAAFGEGYEVDYEGDAFFYAFASAAAAISAVQAAMDALQGGPIRIRVGVHTGEPKLDPPKYIGMDVHRAARIMSAGHGGQVIVSETTRLELDGSARFRELGEHRLKDLAAPIRLYQLGDGDFPRLKALYRSTLPTQSSPLVGRDQELAELTALVSTRRLVTLTGPGGSGKTRLALQVAAESSDAFVDGTHWVGLQAVRDPALVVPAIGEAVEAQGEPAAHIADRRILLLLDNLEQVLDAAPRLADHLAACPNLKLLCTSREPLRIAGESEYLVDPLALGEAVALFTERTMRPGPPGVVREICERLDCLPLAIELAAARTRVLEPEQLRQRLEKILPLLTGGRRDAPDRQQTLRAAIEWSHELLAPDEQRLFARLSVFAGGFTLEAAEAVMEADLDTLQSLAEKSLVKRVQMGRMLMLDTIHEFAEERFDALAERDAVRRSHAEYYSRLAREGEVHRRTPTERAWLEAVAAEHANVRAALAWLVESDLEAAARMAIALERYWLIRGHLVEAGGRVDAILSAPGGPMPDTRALLLNCAARIAWGRGDYVRATALDQEALAIHRELGNDRGAAESLRHLGGVAGSSGDPAAALRLTREAREIYGRLGDMDAAALCDANMGIAALGEGHTADARSALERANEHFVRVGDAEATTIALFNLGLVDLAEGRDEEACLRFAESLQLADEFGSLRDSGYALLGLSAAVVENDAERAAKLLGAADAFIEQAGLPLEEYEKEVRQRAAEEISAGLGAEGFDAAYSRGRSMDVGEAVAFALSGGT